MLMERASGRHWFRTANATSIAILQQNVHPDGKLQLQFARDHSLRIELNSAIKASKHSRSLTHRKTR